MLYIIGLGLGDEKDITLRGLEAIKKCSKRPTLLSSPLLRHHLRWPLQTGKGLWEIYNCFRQEMVEEKANDMLLKAQVTDVAFLVVGDPFGATTHSDLVVRAKMLGVDIKVKEPSLESLCRGKKDYEPPRFMTINITIEQLLEVEQNHSDSAYSKDTTCVGLARVGCEDQMIAAGSMEQLLTIDFGPPLHCLVIVGDTHPVEEEMLQFYSINSS
ncbi:hypothetical protein SASPL_141467 [Salvia splendens]|uniref:diphthine methyl ester synthase n=1 Tax=Salvia splendens TaxID=180675 RepID=A0A8X8WSJ1_SALSN|nr:hypothetical protein SASPL_141467 [Salvia splendens]